MAVQPRVPDEFSTMFFVSRAGFALNAVKDNLPVQGRVAGGVRGIALGDGGECIFASQINGEGEIVVVTAANGFKRVISSWSFAGKTGLARENGAYDT